MGIYNMSESEKLSPLLTILKQFYQIKPEVINGLEKEYTGLSEEDKKFLNDRIIVLLDFHERYSKERENYPELTLQLYRLQVNALRVFLQEKIKQIEEKKSSGDPQQQATLLRAVNAPRCRDGLMSFAVGGGRAAPREAA